MRENDTGLVQNTILLNNRIKFLAGIYPLGFVFFNTHEGHSFHIMDNDNYTFCSRPIFKPRSIEYRRIVIIKRLSELATLYLPPDKKPRFIHKRVLCLICENNFIGLTSGEKYKHNYDHEPLFKLYDDHVRLSKCLLRKLKNPYESNFPVLDSYIKNQIFKVI